MKPFFIILMAISFALPALPGLAADDRSSLAETGEALFHDPSLGGSANELSCNICHSRGHLLENATAIPLIPAIKRCLAEELGGSNEGGQVEMRALALYVLELSEHITGQSRNQPPEVLSGFQPGKPQGSQDLNGFQPRRGRNRGQPPE